MSWYNPNQYLTNGSATKHVGSWGILLVALAIGLGACGGGGGGSSDTQVVSDTTIAGSSSSSSGGSSSSSSGGSSSSSLGGSGATYYVAPNGNDANAGTIDRPWKTLNSAVAKLKAGDTLFARGGTYAELVLINNSGTAGDPITIAAYSGESPVIDGATLSLRNDWPILLTLRGNYIHVSGFELRNLNLSGVVTGGDGVYMYGHHNTVSKLKVHDTWFAGILAHGDNSIVEDSEVWSVVRANCRSTGCTGATRYPTGGWSACLSANRDPANGITDYAILRRNVVHDCWGEGISTFEANGTVIEDNVTYDNWSVNLYLSDTTNALVRRNIVYNTPNNLVGKAGRFLLADEVASKPRSANNVVINNLVYDAEFCAFCWTGVSGSGLKSVLIAHNTILANMKVGSVSGLSEVHTGSSITNNIVTGTVSVPSRSGLTFSRNLWSTTPPENAINAGDVVGDPRISRTGATGAGLLSSGYFKLASNSPAIGKGTSLPQVPTDYFGVTRKTTPDIGGHEYAP